MTNNKKILVTGACGFIGARIVEILFLTKKYDVRAGIRNWASCARIGRFNVDIVEADLLNKNQLKKTLEGISIIVNCALGPLENVEKTTRNLLEAALEKNIKRIIHLSTTEVYGNVNGVIDESFEVEYKNTPYGLAKIAAENVLREFGQKGLDITIFRPPIVYGPFSSTWTLKIAQNLVSGTGALLEGYGSGKCNLLYVDDLVMAILLAIENDHTIGEIFNINGPEFITWNEYFNRFNNALGLEKLKHVKPAESKLKAILIQPIKSFGFFIRDHYMEQLKKIAGKYSFIKALLKKTEGLIKSTPTMMELSLYNRDAIYDSKKAQRILEFKPKFTIDKGLKISTAWLKHHGLSINND